MSRIYIVRHGNTFDLGDTVTRVGARTDLPLSQSGRRQATALGTHFRKQGLRFHYAACSTLQRTHQTLDTILEWTQSPATPEILPFLTELDYGPDENQPENKVITRIGENAIRRWDEEAILPPGWHLDVPQLIQDWRDFFTRAQAQNDSILLVTSNGVARFIFQALQLSSSSHDIKLKTGAYGLLIYSQSSWIVEQWNLRPNFNESAL